MNITGIDVSNGGQGRVNWDDVKGAGISFAYAKVSQGTYFRDPQFARNRAEAKRVGIIVGGYLYWDPLVDAKGQAALFAAQYGQWKPGELPPALDLERDGWIRDWKTENHPPSFYITHALTVAQEMERLTGCKPAIYTFPDFWRVQMGNTDAFKDYSLWIAGYAKAPAPFVGVPHPMVGGWLQNGFAIHQYSDAGYIGPPERRMKVDMDVFNGSMEALMEFCGMNTQPDNGPVELNGHTIHDGFLGLWRKYGFEVMGLPLSDEYVVNEPALGDIPVTYQDFENVICQWYQGIDPRICAGIRKYKYGA